MANYKQVLLVGVAIAAFPQITYAQSAGPPPSASAPEQVEDTSADDGNAGVGLGEILVTARKTRENLQRAAIAVTALNSAAITSRGIMDPTEIGSLLPAVNFKVNSIPSVVIRGLGTYNNQPGVDSAVAYSVDGIYLAHIPALPPVMFDIERVEAVRGPQGTLFGRNSNGGGIAFITNKPTDEAAAKASLTVGNFSTIGTEAMVNVPLGESAAFRVAFGSNSRDPYYKGGQDDANNYGGRARLLVRPAEGLEVIASVDFSRLKTAGQGLTYCPKNDPTPDCSGRDFDPYRGNLPGSFLRINTFAAYLEANYDGGIGDITWLTGYRRYHLENAYVLPGLDYRPSNTDRYFTQELRIASKASSPVKWVAGLFYSRETLHALERYSFFGNLALDSEFDRYVATSKAAFAQVTVPVAGTVRLTGGIRYTDERKKSVGHVTTYGGPSPIVAPTAGGSKESKVTWKGGIEADVGDSSLVYASASNGFKSGGVNNAPAGSGLESYAPESIRAYQLGTKNRFLNDHLQINAEGFYYKLRGYQAYSQVGIGPTTFFLTVNSQQATFYGGEIESSILVSDDDRIDLSLSLLHAKFDAFVTPLYNFSGNKVQSAPKASFTASYQHIFHLSDGAVIRASVDSKLVSGHYEANNNLRATYQSRYTRSGASVSYESTKGWQVTAFVRNIENKGILMAYADPIFEPAGYGVYEPPRTFGGTVTINF